MKRLALTALLCGFLLCAFGTAQAATPTIAQRTIGSSIHNLNANTVTYRFPHTTGANNLIVCGIITGSRLTSITATDDSRPATPILLVQKRVREDLITTDATVPGRQKGGAYGGQ
jgi:hypothetical protein